jgi:hypothetical protein
VPFWVGVALSPVLATLSRAISALRSETVTIVVDVPLIVFLNSSAPAVSSYVTVDTVADFSALALSKAFKLSFTSFSDG